MTTRTSYGVGRYGQAAEDDLIYQTRKHHLASTRPKILFFPQHATAAYGLVTTSYYHSMLSQLAKQYVVCAVTPGGITHWGSPTARSRVFDVDNYLNAEFGTNGKFGIVATSMGSLLALNFAKANPTVVDFVACMLPAINLSHVRSQGYSAGIDAAYGQTYSDATFGSTSNPYYYRASYPGSSVPTALFTSSDDDVALPIYADAFLDAQPSVERVNIGAYQHTEAGIAAAIGPMLEWVRARTPESPTGAQFTYPGGGPPPETLGPNLLAAVNANAPTFDANIGGWTNYYGTLSRTTVAGEVRTGAGALKHVAGAAPFIAFYSPYMNVTPGQKYRCTGWVKGSGQIRFNLFRGSAMIFTNPTTVTLTSTWQQFSFDYIPAAGETNLVIFPEWMAIPGTLNMDDVYFGTVT